MYITQVVKVGLLHDEGGGTVLGGLGGGAVSVWGEAATLWLRHSGCDTLGVVESGEEQWAGSRDCWSPREESWVSGFEAATLCSCSLGGSEAGSSSSCSFAPRECSMESRVAEGSTSGWASRTCLASRGEPWAGSRGYWTWSRSCRVSREEP